MRSSNATDAWLLQVGTSIREEFANTRRVLTFASYLDLVSAQPTRHIRDAARYALDCFDYLGSYEVTTPRGTETRYRLFDAPWDATGEERLVGQEAVAAAVYRLIASSVRQGNVSHVILLHGPNGSAKSTLLRTIGRALEYYSTLPDGALYRFSWVFPKSKPGKASIGFGGASEPESLESFALASDDAVDARVGDELRDHPLLLLPMEQRRAFMKHALGEVGLAGTHLVPDTLEHGALSPKNRAIFDALLASYGGDYLKVLRHVRVERFYIDERFRQGYVTVEPQMSVDASERQVTADRSLGALPASLQTLALFEYGGELVNANRGLIEYDDLLKRPLESYKYLLTTVERGSVSLQNSALAVDVLYVASSNETHVAAFKEYPDFQSFRGRFAFVRAPYLLSVPLERELYRLRLREAAGARHVAPHTDYVLALFAVLSRMRKPQVEAYPERARDLVASLSPLAKADLYAEGRVPEGVVGEAAKQLRALVKDLVAESDEYPHYEGKYGASPREMIAILMTAASSTKFSYVSPFVVLEELAALIKQTSLYEYLRLEPEAGGFHDHPAILEAVRARLGELVERDVQDALGLVADVEHARVFERYMQHVTHWVRGEKLRNASTGNMEAPDVQLMSTVEASLIVDGVDAKRYRDTLVTKVGAWSIDHPGQRPNFEVVFAEEHARLQAAYYAKVRNKIADGLDNLLQALAGHVAAEPAPITEALERLYAKGYQAASARDLLGFLRTTRFRK